MLGLVLLERLQPMFPGNHHGALRAKPPTEAETFEGSDSLVCQRRLETILLLAVMGALVLDQIAERFVGRTPSWNVTVTVVP